MKINNKTCLASCRLLLLFLYLPSYLFAGEEEFFYGDSEETLVLNLEAVTYLALNNSDRLFESRRGIRAAELLSEISYSEFDTNIIPRGDSGFIGGGSAGSGLTVGGGIDFEKKLPMGTRIFVSPSMLKAADKYHSSLTARISQPLLRGFGSEYNLAGIMMSQFVQRSAARSFYRTMNHIVFNAIELLYDVFKQESFASLSKASYERLDRFWRSTKLKEKIGLANGMDVHRAEIELKVAEEALNRSNETLDDAKDRLRHLLGLSQETPFVVSVSLEASQEEWDLQQAIKVAISERIEVDQALDQIDESRRLVRLSEKELLPQLNLVLDYSNLGYGEEFTGSFGRKRESRWGVGLTTSSDVCSAREKSAYERALTGVEAAKIGLNEVKKTIALEIKKTLRNLYRAKEKIALQRQQIKNLEGGLKLVKAKLLREYATSFDVIQAEKAFHTAQVGLASALIDYKVNEYRLKAVMGLLIENPFKCS